MKTTQTPGRTTTPAPTTAGHEPEIQRPQLPALEEQQQAASRGHWLESLPLGRPDDRYEQEADRTAAQVVARLESGSGPSGPIQATPTPGPAVQAKSDGGGSGGSAAALPQLSPAPGSGRPLEPAVRGPLERAMSANLGDVRLHTDQPAQQLNQTLRARATTVGPDIHFAEGKYRPESPAGRELLAHELTHVLQQRHGGWRLQREHSDDESDDDEGQPLLGSGPRSDQAESPEAFEDPVEGYDAEDEESAEEEAPKSRKEKAKAAFAYHKNYNRHREAFKGKKERVVDRGLDITQSVLKPVKMVDTSGTTAAVSAGLSGARAVKDIAKEAHVLSKDENRKALKPLLGPTVKGKDVAKEAVSAGKTARKIVKAGKRVAEELM